MSLEEQFKEGRAVRQAQLINALNFINFQNGYVLLNFCHPRYDRTISLAAVPEPSADTHLTCRWVENIAFAERLLAYRFVSLLLERDGKIIVIKADVGQISDNTITLTLPESGCEVSSRKFMRHLTRDVKAEIIQNGAVFAGALRDFNSRSFGVEIYAEPPQTFLWINEESTVHLALRNHHGLYYSGECAITRQTGGRKKRFVVLKPVQERIQRYEAKKVRSTRHELTPSPTITFVHPLTKRIISLEAGNLSCSGFSLEEHDEDSVLFPGLMVPEVDLEIANDFLIRCRTQVVYSSPVETPEKNGRALIKHGVAILDMDIQDQVRLSGLLQRITNKRSFINNRIDIEGLWKFFFQAGFIYPGKYASICQNKDYFRETYEKLYLQSPAISRHFVYQDKGEIQGHLAMLRLYENTWMMHHHASIGNSLAGFAVLNHATQYVNDYRFLASTHMDYIMCYYRPENRFPSRVFGGFASSLNNRKGCSIDPFAYTHLHRFAGESQELGGEWSLTPTDSQDLFEVNNYYEYESKGLLLSALDLDDMLRDGSDLNKEYESLGFHREKHHYSLRKGRELKAIFILTISDTGLNMSSLSNCVHVIVLDGDNLPRDAVYAVLARFAKDHFHGSEASVLLYPVRFAEQHLVPFEKTYNLWIFDTRYVNRFFDYMDTMLRHE